MTRPGPYAAHLGFVAPARGTPGLRPVILVFIIVESLYRLGQHLFGSLLDTLDPDFAEAVIQGSTATGLLINLGSFLLLGLSLALVIARVHGRGLASLLGPHDRLWPLLIRSFTAVALVFVLYEIALNGFTAGPGAMTRPLSTWLVLLGPALLALLIQIGSEELFYRGYLQQHVAALMPRPAAWLILPNIAFALAHWNASAPLPDNLAYLVWAFCFGLAASDLTARSGSLGPALGLHLANNAYAFLFFGIQDGPDSGLALVLLPAPDPALLPDAPIAAGLPAELLLLAVTWAAVRLALRH